MLKVSTAFNFVDKIYYFVFLLTIVEEFDIEEEKSGNIFLQTQKLHHLYTFEMKS